MSDESDWEDVQGPSSKDAEALARMIESEAGGTPEIAQRGVAHAALNYAAGRPISEVLLHAKGAANGRYGHQDEGRYASTAKAASPTSLRIVQEVLSGKSQDPTGGAIQWDSPKAYAEAGKADAVAASRQSEGKRIVTLPGVPSSTFRFYAKGGTSPDDGWEDVPAPSADDDSTGAPTFLGRNEPASMTPEEAGIANAPLLKNTGPDLAGQFPRPAPEGHPLARWDDEPSIAEDARAHGWSTQDEINHLLMPDAHPLPHEAALGFLGFAAAGLGGMLTRSIPAIGRMAQGTLPVRTLGGTLEGLGGGTAQTLATHGNPVMDIGIGMLTGGMGGALAKPYQLPNYDPNYQPNAHEPRTSREVDAATLKRTADLPPYETPLAKGGAGTHQMAKDLETGIRARMDASNAKVGELMGRDEAAANRAIDNASGIPEPIDYGPDHFGDTKVEPREKMVHMVPGGRGGVNPEPRLGPNDYEPQLDKTKAIDMDWSNPVHSDPTVVDSSFSDPTMADGMPIDQTVANGDPTVIDRGGVRNRMFYMDPELEQLAGIRARRTSDVAGPLDDSSHGRMLEIEKHLGSPQATAEEARRAGQDAEWLNTKADRAAELAAKSGDEVHIANAEKLRRSADDAAALADKLAGMAKQQPVSFNDIRKVATEGGQRIRNRVPGDKETAADLAAAGVLSGASRRLDPRPEPIGPDVPESMHEAYPPRHFGEALDRYKGVTERNDTINETTYGAKGSRPPDGLTREEAARNLLAKAGAHDFEDKSEGAQNAQERLRTIEANDPGSRDIMDRIRARNTKDRRAIISGQGGKNVPYSFSALGAAKWGASKGANLAFKLAPPHINAEGQAFTPEKGAAMQAIPLELQMFLMQNQRRREEEQP